MENQTGQPSKRNSNVIYFLIVVVLALFATDIYLYLQKNKSDTKIVYQDAEKNQMQKKLQTELDSLESQIEQVNQSKTRLSAVMQSKNDSLQQRIVVLRTQLAKNKLTRQELLTAQTQMTELRSSVAQYEADIESLKKQNTSLAAERDTLKTNLETVNDKAATLQKKNQDLDNTVKVASAIKLATATVVAYKIKGSGKEVEIKRASPAKKIKITFTIANNSVAEKGMHDIYTRIIDPTGNLVIASDSGAFKADGQQLQYTYKTSIDFKDDGSSYTIDWLNPAPFQKGTYTVMLYADGFTMGKTEFMLK